MCYHCLLRCLPGYAPLNCRMVIYIDKFSLVQLYIPLLVLYPQSPVLYVFPQSYQDINMPHLVLKVFGGRVPSLQRPGTSLVRLCNDWGNHGGILTAALFALREDKGREIFNVIKRNEHLRFYV